MNNMAAVEPSYRVLRSVDSSVTVEAQVSIAKRILTVLSWDRYDLYFGSERAIIYELDEDQLLQRFYQAVGQLKLGADLQGQAHWNEAELGQWLRASIHFGRQYISKKKLKYRPTPNPLETAFTEAMNAASGGNQPPTA